MLKASKVDVKDAIKTKIAQLDHLYMQIKIQHEKAEYRKSALLFKEVHVVQRQLEQLQEKVKLYETIERLNGEGILVGVVKKPNESMAVG